VPAPHAPDLWLWGAQRPFPLITHSSQANPGKHLMRVMVARWATSSLVFAKGSGARNDFSEHSSFLVFFEAT